MKRLSRNITLLIFSLFLMTSAQATSLKNVSALSCEAVFLDQAFDLKWDSIRITNRHPSLGRWVVCPISRTNSSAPETGIFGYINYRYLATTNFATPNSSCILREIDSAGDISYTKSVTLSNPGAGSSYGQYFSIPAGDLSSSAYSYWTMSCKLSPQVALMSFDLNIED